MSYLGESAVLGALIKQQSKLLIFVDMQSELIFVIGAFFVCQQIIGYAILDWNMRIKDLFLSIHGAGSNLF